VVALGCIVTGYKYVKWLTKIIKDAYPATKVVVGYAVASSIPEILLTKRDSDIAVIGEGDETIVELLKRLETSDDLTGVRGVHYKHSGQMVQNPPRRHM